jgi:hypothetical protein
VIKIETENARVRYGTVRYGIVDKVGLPSVQENILFEFWPFFWRHSPEIKCENSKNSKVSTNSEFLIEKKNILFFSENLLLELFWNFDFENDQK